MSSNITSLYVATARLIFQPHISNPVSWAYEVGNLFPSLCELLRCSVCQSLLVDPYSPRDLCQHHVCKTCLGKDKILSQPCLLCVNAKDHVENEELSLLLVCYNKLCSYIRQSSTLLKYLSECGGDTDLMNIIIEGESYLSLPLLAPPVTNNVTDSFQSYHSYSSPTPSTSSSSSSNHHHHHKHRRSYTPQCNGNSMLSEFQPQPIYSVLVANEGNKITIKRKVPDEYNVSAVNTRIKPTKTSKSGGCRCGLATAAPGKLTCCGQRCLCYTEQKPCKGCKCRGCRNPHTANGKKKLRGLEEFQMTLCENPNTTEEMIGMEEQLDTTIVGINSSSNDFQEIRFVNQEEPS
ncbi:hypothetical protein M8J75_007792 [Diaphorina citri]|nr:hypothetical protein M8J75_007792 [Diaphorina citri]